MRGVALGGSACAACALMAYAVRGRSSALLAPSVYRGSRQRRSIALTFDDGPSEGTSQLLEILNRYQTPATFFVCGMNVKRLPGAVRDAAAAGHEIGNHSYSHPALYLRSRRFIHDELAAAQAAIADATGAAPSSSAPPSESAGSGCAKAQRGLNLLGVMWTVIGLDWKLTGRPHRPPDPGRSRKRRHHMPARRTRRASQSRYRRHPGSGWAADPGSSIPWFYIRNGKPNTMPDQLTQRVLNTIATTQRISPEKVTIDSSFQELGIDSMDGINILFALENEFDITIPDEQAKQIRSVRDMVEGVGKLVAESTAQGAGPVAGCAES